MNTANAHNLASDNVERQAEVVVRKGGGNVAEFRVRALLRKAEAMIETPELSDSEFRLLFQLVFRDRGGQGTHAAVGTMAASTGKSERAAHRALASLRRKKSEWITVTTHPEFRTKNYKVRFPADAHLAARKPREERQGTPLKVAGQPPQECQPTMTNSSYKESESLSQREREIHYAKPRAKPDTTPVDRPLIGRSPASSKAKAADAAERAEKLRRNSQKWISAVDHLVVPAMPSWTNIRMGTLRRVLEHDEARVRQRGYDVLREAFEMRRQGDDQEKTADWIESQFREVDPGPNRTEVNP